MTLARSPIQRRTRLAPGGPLKRTTPLRQRSTKPSARRRKAEQEGPQWRLCHETECVACFHARWVRTYGRTVPVDWTKLGPGQGNHGHHEPTRARGGKDRHCLSLCPPDHETRHRVGAVAFWLCIDVDGALREMNRRAYPTKSLAPMPGTEGEESVASPANATLPGERQSPDPIPGQHPTETTT